MTEILYLAAGFVLARCVAAGIDYWHRRHAWRRADEAGRRIRGAE